MSKKPKGKIPLFLAFANLTFVEPGQDLSKWTEDQKRERIEKVIKESGELKREYRDSLIEDLSKKGALDFLYSHQVIRDILAHLAIRPGPTEWFISLFDDFNDLLRNSMVGLKCGGNRFLLDANIKEPSLIDKISFDMAKFLEHFREGIFSRCPICGKFCLTTRSDQIYCSDKCKRRSNWPPEKWKKYMQEYREEQQKEAQKTKAKFDEMQVQRIMKVLKITREEAIEQVNIDKKL